MSIQFGARIPVEKSLVALNNFDVKDVDRVRKEVIGGDPLAPGRAIEVYTSGLDHNDVKQILQNQKAQNQEPLAYFPAVMSYPIRNPFITGSKWTRKLLNWVDPKSILEINRAILIEAREKEGLVEYTALTDEDALILGQGLDCKA